MAFSVTAFPYCCGASIFANLGGDDDHGDEAGIKNFDQLARKIVGLGHNRLNIIITNDEQDEQEEWLKKLGFKCVQELESSKLFYNSLRLWTVESEILEEHLTETKETIKQERIKAQKEKEEKERLAKLELEKKTLSPLKPVEKQVIRKVRKKKRKTLNTDHLFKQTW